MISDEDRQKLCALIDDLRLRGVHVIHIETASNSMLVPNVKLEIHVNPLSEGELPRAKSAQDAMIEKGNVTPEERAVLEQQQADRDLFNDRNDDDADE